MDSVQTTVPESAAASVQPPKELSKPKAEVVSNKADSSSSTTERHQTHKRHITVQSHKRKRWESSSKDNETDEFSSPPKRSKKHTHERRSHRETPDRHNTADSSKKGDRDQQISDDRVVQAKDDVSSLAKSNLPQRIVSGFKGGSLQITILRGQFSD